MPPRRRLPRKGSAAASNGNQPHELCAPASALLVPRLVSCVAIAAPYVLRQATFHFPTASPSDRPSRPVRCPA